VLADAEDTSPVTPFGRMLASFPGDLSLGKVVALGAACSPNPPNLLLVTMDTTRLDAIGAYGQSAPVTPNLDRLSKEGALFTNGYAACPVCSPTRAAFQTGRWPQRTGITDYIGSPLKPELWKRNTQLLPAPYQDRLAHEEVSLAEMMKTAGYATFFAGKWHLGMEGWYPEDQGYEINQGGVEKGGPYGPGSERAEVFPQPLPESAGFFNLATLGAAQLVEPRLANVHAASAAP
jgi:arylsulfatase A-like enzyme